MGSSQALLSLLPEFASPVSIMTEVEIPKQCKAGVVVNEGPDFRIEVQMVDVPEPKDDEVLLKLNCTGLCMSDVHFMLNDWAVPPMSTFNCKCAGHEGAGEVVNNLLPVRQYIHPG